MSRTTQYSRASASGAAVDFKAVAHLALSSVERVLAYWLPGGKYQGSEYLVRNPMRPDRSMGSFSINRQTGKWADFAAGMSGGDLIALVAYLERVTQPEAAGMLADFLGVERFKRVQGVRRVSRKAGRVNSRVYGARSRNTQDSAVPASGVPVSTSEGWRWMDPIPSEIGEPPERHPQLGQPAGVWCYRAPSGEPSCYVFRFDTLDGKQFRPLGYGEETETGEKGWRWAAPSEPRPLYNRHLLARYPEAVVVVCEGEKAAEAAGRLLPSPEFVTTTAMNGCKSVTKADWTILAGRTVCLWPDHDEAGRQGMAAVARILHDIGAAVVWHIELDGFRPRPDGSIRDLPAKWDAADAEIEGYTAEQVLRVMGGSRSPIGGHASRLNAPAELVDANPIALAVTEQIAAVGFAGECTYRLIQNTKPQRDGVYFYPKGRDGEALSPVWICSPLRVLASTRSVNQDGWGRLLQWQDPDGCVHTWAAPMTLLVGDGADLCRQLVDRGLRIEPGLKNREHLMRYLNAACPTVTVRCTERTGWHEGQFVLPHRTFGKGDEQYIFQSSGDNTVNPFRAYGTLDEWRREIAALCAGNSRLLFAVSAAFASVLLGLTGDENGGFHLLGHSSEGKSTVLYAAASVFGSRHYVQRWNATVNGLEALAASHSGALLVLDELGQLDPRQAGETAYLLANGFGKARANRSGKTRQRQGWQLIFLSSGEVDLAQHMSEAGQRAKAGQEIRLLTIPANPGAGMGIYEELHGFSNGAELSKVIGERSRKVYGTAGIAFIEALINNLDQVVPVIEQLKTEFLEEHLPSNASGQARRAGERFALAGIAGEMATQWQLTGWTPGEASKAAGKCFRAWLNHRGGGGNRETQSILTQVRQFFELHGESRFSPWDCDHCKGSGYVDTAAGQAICPSCEGKKVNGGFQRITHHRAGFRKMNDVGDLDFYVLPEAFTRELCKGFDPKSVTRLLIDRGILLPDNAGKSSRSVTLPGLGKTRAYLISGERLWGSA